jgi:hypothetical protein
LQYGQFKLDSIPKSNFPLTRVMNEQYSGWWCMGCNKYKPLYMKVRKWEFKKGHLLKVLIVTWNGKIVTVQALQHQEIFFSIMIHMDLKTLMGFLYSNCVNHDNLKMYLLIYNSKYGIHDKFGGNLKLVFWLGHVIFQYPIAMWYGIFVDMFTFFASRDAQTKSFWKVRLMRFEPTTTSM